MEQDDPHAVRPGAEPEAGVAADVLAERESKVEVDRRAGVQVGQHEALGGQAVAVRGHAREV